MAIIAILLVDPDDVISRKRGKKAHNSGSPAVAAEMNNSV
jgi:hypothetical protein